MGEYSHSSSSKTFRPPPLTSFSIWRHREFGLFVYLGDRRVMSNEMKMNKNSNAYFHKSLETKVFRAFFEYLRALIILFKINK